jgi:stringent starvation protein B
MSSFKYYIFDAVYRWATDAGYTPHIVVDTKIPGVSLPAQFDGQDSITLNISSTAANNFSIEDSGWLFFSTRFAGHSHNIEIPLPAIQAVYAKETGAGISFTGSQWDDPDGSPPGKDTKKNSDQAKAPALKIVK